MYILHGHFEEEEYDGGEFNVNNFEFTY